MILPFPTSYIHTSLYYFVSFFFIYLSIFLYFSSNLYVSLPLYNEHSQQKLLNGRLWRIDKKYDGSGIFNLLNTAKNLYSEKCSRLLNTYLIKKLELDDYELKAHQKISILNAVVIFFQVFFFL